MNYIFVLTADYDMDSILPNEAMDDAFRECVRLFDGKRTAGGSGGGVRDLEAQFETMVSPRFEQLKQMLLDRGFKDIWWGV
jgi:hypothetical protein